MVGRLRRAGRESWSPRPGDRIAGLAVSGIGPVLLPADGAGRPLRPAILYGVDTRASAEIAELTEELGAAEILRRGGTPLSSQAVGPKLRWLARHEPEVYDRTELLLMASSYLVHRLTGRYVLDHHSASQCDPMYDLRAVGLGPRLGRGGRAGRDAAGAGLADRGRRHGHRGGGRAKPGCRKDFRSPRARSTRGRRRPASACASPAT